MKDMFMDLSICIIRCKFYKKNNEWKFLQKRDIESKNTFLDLFDNINLSLSFHW